MQFKYLLFCYILQIVSVYCDDPLIVTSEDGDVRGRILQDKDGNDFYAFQKIPYAEKPLGDLRFKAPQQVLPWNGTLDGTSPSPNCIQPNENHIDEDCLYLNVYTHRNPDLEPVMIYIYGGAFVVGSADPIVHLGPLYLLTKKVVLITFNYRLGFLGFMSYEDAPEELRPEVSPNNGFKDQVMVLEWIQRNIKYFGGDPFSVTVFGNSAGGIATNLLLLSPLTKNLFHRVIIQSATAMTRGIALNNSALMAAEALNISTEDPVTLIESLRNVSTDDIVRVQTALDIGRLTIEDPVPAGLVIERPGPNAFLSENPWTLIKAGNYYRCPILTGIVDAEGLIFYVYKFLKLTNQYFNIESFVPYYYNQREFVSLVIDEDFFPTQNYSDLSAWIKVWGYTSFIFDLIRNTMQLKQFSDVYFYYFEVDANLNWSKMRAPIAAKVPGACHGDELGYLFSMNTVPKPQKGSFEDLTVERMTTLWSNFATYSMPVIENSSLFDHQPWIPIRDNMFNSFRIGRNITSALYNLSNIDYWRNLYEVFSNGEL